MANQDDVLINWSGNLKPDFKGDMDRVAQLMDRKLAEGISIDSAIEIIAGAGYKLDVVKKVAASRRKEIQDATQPKMVEAERAPEPPKNYSDVSGKIRGLIMAMPAEDVLSMLSGKAKSSPSLIRLTEKERKQFKTIVATAKISDDDLTLSEIDRWVSPHVETAIVDSEILAAKLSANEDTSVEDLGDGTFVVSDSDGRRSAVDMSTMSCTCSRYVFGSFAHTGLACEHILCVKASMGE